MQARPQGLLRPDKLVAAPLLSKTAELRAESSAWDGTGWVMRGAGSGPHLALLVPQSHVGQMCW